MSLKTETYNKRPFRPAFPSQEKSVTGPYPYSSTPTITHKGISDRLYIAAQILPGLLQADSARGEIAKISEKEGKTVGEVAAKIALMFADDLIEEERRGDD